MKIYFSDKSSLEDLYKRIDRIDPKFGIDQIVTVKHTIDEFHKLLFLAKREKRTVQLEKTVSGENGENISIKCSSRSNLSFFQKITMK
tara:strand:+ start:193 stop:456 length:264 start_codon:yes stop_codon:yes gene_type:complete